MSWMDEEIDNVFKEAANQPTFEYRPEYWKDIEKQLPVNKKRRTFVWWWASGVLLIGMISYTFVEYNGEGINNEIANLNEDSADKIEMQTKNENISKTITQNASITNSSASSINENGNNSGISNQGNTVGAKENRNILETVPAFNKTEVQPTDFVNEPVNNVVLDEVIEMESQIDKVITRTTRTTDNTESKEISLKTIPFTYVSPEGELIASAPFEAKIRSSRYYFEFNGGIGQEYTHNDPSDVNANFGGSFGVNLPLRQFAFTAGIGYQGTKFSNLNIKDRTLIYGFGAKTLENSYVFSSIHAVVVPLALNYSFSRHSFSLGMTTSMNFITRLKHSQSLDGERTLYESGVSDVSFFNRFSLQPSFGYSFYVNDRTQIGARINLELLDQLKSDRFIGEHTKMPFNGQFYLRRTLDF